MKYFRFISSTLLLTMLISVSAQAAEPIVGLARIIDGDTIRISGNRIRLHGIDAPEAKQTCVAAGKSWACGRNATFALSAIIERQWVHCHQKDKDRYGRIVAVCNLAGNDGPDVNAAMVRQGWALAYRRYSMDYVEDEDAARKAKAGLWAGSFVAPWDWRQGKRLKAANDNVAGKCLIKGNIGKRGVRIYHIPGGAYYERTRIDEQKGERWFCAEADARAAGWRRSKR
jgi:endonuclease YncB( thermonuclease family)